MVGAAIADMRRLSVGTLAQSPRVAGWGGHVSDLLCCACCGEPMSYSRVRVLIISMHSRCLGHCGFHCGISTCPPKPKRIAETIFSPKLWSTWFRYRANTAAVRTCAGTASSIAASIVHRASSASAA